VLPSAPHVRPYPLFNILSSTSSVSLQIEILLVLPFLDVHERRGKSPSSEQR